MSFVYQGSGRRVAADADVTVRKCRDEACGIQWCLARSNHIEARCQDYIDIWKKCCEAARAHERATSSLEIVQRR
jgi:hypothetical protein